MSTNVLQSMAAVSLVPQDEHAGIARFLFSSFVFSALSPHYSLSKQLHTNH